MFGINSQAAPQDSSVVSDHTQELPVGGDDLLASGAPAANPSPIIQPTADSAIISPTQTDELPDQIPADLINPSANDDLINLKKDALQQLTPLVGHLDQTPEEKFRTTMMLIQATDDKTLLRSAYESALQIPDEKSKAQALLDVVNEINYFTHPEAQ